MKPSEPNATCAACEPSPDSHHLRAHVTRAHMNGANSKRVHKRHKWHATQRVSLGPPLKGTVSALCIRVRNDRGIELVPDLLIC